MNLVLHNLEKQTHKRELFLKANINENYYVDVVENVLFVHALLRRCV